MGLGIFILILRSKCIDESAFERNLDVLPWNEQSERVLAFVTFLQAAIAFGSNGHLLNTQETT